MSPETELVGVASRSRGGIGLVTVIEPDVDPPGARLRLQIEEIMSTGRTESELFPLNRMKN